MSYELKIAAVFRMCLWLLTPITLGHGSFALAEQSERQAGIAGGGSEIALVIGNSSYVNSPLKNPANDARLMASVLLERNYSVTQHTNLGAQELRRAIRKFGDKITKETTVVFYFAGHGLQAGGRNFLVPVDAQITRETNIRSESIDIEEVIENLSLAKSLIIILDACRNNPFEKGFRATFSSGLAPIEAPKGTLLAYATAPGRVALDGIEREQNSIYTEALSKAIRTPNLKIEEMFKRARIEVAARTNDAQIPWESSSLTGDYCFGGCANIESQLGAQLRQLQAELDLERSNIQREKSRLEAEKALALKQKQLLEAELVERNNKQDALATQLKMEKSAIQAEMKKMLADYQERLADEAAARARAEEDAIRAGKTSALELAKLKREKDLLENEKAAARKQQQILENEIRDKTNQQREVAEKLRSERDAIELDRQRILSEYRSRVLESDRQAGRDLVQTSKVDDAEVTRMRDEIRRLQSEKAQLEEERRIVSKSVAENASGDKPKPVVVPIMF